LLKSLSSFFTSCLLYSGTLHAQLVGVAEPFILESPYKWNEVFLSPWKMLCIFPKIEAFAGIFSLLLYKTLQDICNFVFCDENLFVFHRDEKITYFSS